MLDKLTQAIANVVLDHKPAKRAMLKVNLFTPMLVYLSQSVEMLDKEPYYSESRVIATLNLLS